MLHYGARVLRQQGRESDLLVPGISPTFLLFQPFHVWRHAITSALYPTGTTCLAMAAQRHKSGPRTLARILKAVTVCSRALLHLRAVQIDVGARAHALRVLGLVKRACGNNAAGALARETGLRAQTIMCFHLRRGMSAAG
eukprot:6173068-Pleurochrysis_carterae.AAC.1